MTQTTPGVVKRIAIIGAGPSGLATAKYVSGYPLTQSMQS